MSNLRDHLSSATKDDVLPCAAGSISHTIIVSLTHRALASLKLTCATPTIAPAIGMTTCATAGAVATCAATLVRSNTFCSNEDLAIGAATSIAVFACTNGKFASLLPSNVAKPGAFAAKSLPASGPEYASDSEKKALISIYYRSGCHTCGTRSRSETVVGDHLPPNFVAYGGRKVSDNLQKLGGDARGVIGLIRRARARAMAASGPLESLSAFVPPPPQRFYPQCQSCSNIQASAVREKVTTAITHGVPRSWRVLASGAGSGFARAEQDTRSSASNKHSRAPLSAR